MKKILFLFLTFYFVNAKAQISITFTNVVQPCNGNGAATALVTGGTTPYTYKWDQHLYYPVQWNCKHLVDKLSQASSRIV